MHADDLRQADRPDGDVGGEGQRSSTGRLAAAREERLRRTMQVHVAAWMLSPAVDEQRVAAHLARVGADMKQGS